MYVCMYVCVCILYVLSESDLSPYGSFDKILRCQRTSKSVKHWSKLITCTCNTITISGEAEACRYMCMYIYICVCVCVYVCMYVCMCVCT